jgi:hypothetical protein
MSEAILKKLKLSDILAPHKCDEWVYDPLATWACSVKVELCSVGYALALRTQVEPDFGVKVDTRVFLGWAQVAFEDWAAVWRFRPLVSSLVA